MKHKPISMRLSAVVLLVLMIALPACAGEGGGVETTAAPIVQTTSPDESTSAPAETTADPNARPDDPLPATLRFDGERVRFISRDRSWVDDDITVETMNGDVTNDAVHKRQLIVEERLGVSFYEYKTGGKDSYAVTDEVKKLVLANSTEYDVMVNAIYSSIISTGDALYRNLYQIPHLNLENPWWSQGFNAEASIGNAQYMCTGDIAISLKRMTFATFFNKKMFEDHQIPNIYQTVRDGKWTMERQGEIAAGMYEDLNGNQTRDIDDKFGFMATNNKISLDPYWSSCDMRILGKTAQNTYEFVLDAERFDAVIKAAEKLFWENEGSWGLAQEKSDAEQETIAKRFGAGDVGMVTLRLIEAESQPLREMEDTYGIIPIPKLNEEIAAYYSYAHDQFNALAILSTVPDERIELIGAVLEELAYEGRYIVSPAYYDTALKYKYASDIDSGEMLDLIFENFRLDAGIFYSKSLGNVHDILREVVGANANNGVSRLYAESRVVKKKLEQLQNKILSLPT